MKYNSVKRLLCAAFALTVALPGVISSGGYSVKAVAAKENVAEGLSLTDSFKYSAYAESYASEPTPDGSIVISAGSGFKASSSAKAAAGEMNGRDGVLLWTSSGGEISWSFKAEKSGRYFLRATYISLSDSATDVQLGLKLDGKTPFFEAEQLTLVKCFKSESEIKQNKKGNDIRPKQISYGEWVTSSFADDTGVTDSPYAFYLTEGTHTLTLVGSLANIAVDTLEFYNSAELPSYNEYSNGAKPCDEAYTMVYEAENTLYTSSSILYPTYDRTSADTSPADPVKLKYNTVGQSNFSSPGQYIVWSVEAPADGYYYLGARIRQNISLGTNSYRRLYVNGEVPFEEANEVKFTFSNRWQEYVFGGKENPWLIKLNRGENQIKLEVVSGGMTEVLSRLQALVTETNNIYREIIMITGVSPDTYRDYHINKEISNFDERVKALSDEAQAIFELALSLGNTKSGNFSAITKLKMLLDDFLETPSNIPGNISTLSSYSSGISSLITTVKSQPLELDTITVSTDTDKLKTEHKGFFGNAAFQAKAFLGSFVEDYSEMGDTDSESENQVKVWVSLGRDQANVIKSLADSLFTPEEDISVNVSLVQQSLIQATLSGMSPDVVLFVGNTEPVNLAMRGGLTPLSQFDTFNRVTERFQENSMDAYYFNGDWYAVPVAESFQMMFYRTDIFEALGLEPPETWDDLYKIIRVLQQNNLTVGIPNADSSNVMSVDTGIFATLMYQAGETFYSDDFKTTRLDSDIGINAFNIWTEFYKDYGLPYQFDFFNRFRSGDMPIGLSTYSLYGKFKQAAPELEGLWKMAPVPGTLKEDGTIDRSVCATSTCAVIMNGSKNKDGAWKFVDWFTSSEAQVAYGTEMEALLGPTGRHTPSNTQALAGLPWTYEEQQLIYAQWNESFTLPQIPGSYIVDRNLVNAFRKVVFSSANPRETIISYNNTIEEEIARKRKEFNLD